MTAQLEVQRPAPRPSVAGFLQSVSGRRTALGGLLVGAGLLYSLGLSASGWANAYYSAAAQAGAQSWRALFFGALDPAGGITVDKPPASVWLTSLSVRLFGLSTQSLLLPQAACGVATVALLYGAVRRQALTLLPVRPASTTSPPTTGDVDPESQGRASAVGLLAGSVLALTPVVTLMSRYDNPDALLVALTVGAAYALVRSVGMPRGGGGWLALAGALLGLAFLTKLLQAWLVLPAFLAVALLAGAGSIGRRWSRVLVAAAAMVAAAGWWVLVVQLIPASARPWIGGTQHNSVLELALGYNGLGRLTGQENAGTSTGTTRPGNWLRLFGSWAPEASWLLPAAVAALVSGWIVTRGRTRRDPARAGLLLWGAWLLGVGAVLSSLRGISHSYYAVQLAPAIAGSLALGGALLWQRVWSPAAGAWPRWTLVGGVLTSAAWSVVLLLHRPAWPTGIAPVTVAAASVAVLGLLLARTASSGPPPTAVGMAGHLDGRARNRRVVLGGALAALLIGPASWSVATAQTVHRGANVVSGPGVTSVRMPAGYSPGSTSSTRLPLALTDTLRAGAAGYTWSAAVTGRLAADLELASGASVWELGGYNGGEPHPALAEFQAAMAAHQVHYLVVAGRPGSGSAEADRIGRWAAAHLPARRVGGWLLFDLSAGAPAVAGSDGTAALPSWGR